MLRTEFTPPHPCPLPCSSIGPLGARVTSLYESAGRRKATVNAVANRTSYSYAPSGNLDRRTRSGIFSAMFSASEVTMSISRRSLLGMACAALVGLVAKASGAVAAVRHSVRPRSHDSAEARRQTVYTWDSLGRLRSVRDRSGVATWYVYDPNSPNEPAYVYRLVELLNC